MRWDRVYVAAAVLTFAGVVVPALVAAPGWAAGLVLFAWFSVLLGLTYPLQRWENARPCYRVASPLRIAELEREVLEPIEDVIARIDRELSPKPALPAEDAFVFAGKLSSGWKSSGSSFAPSCADCTWTTIRAYGNRILRWELADPCPTHERSLTPA